MRVVEGSGMATPISDHTPSAKELLRGIYHVEEPVLVLLLFVDL